MSFTSLMKIFYQVRREYVCRCNCKWNDGQMDERGVVEVEEHFLRICVRNLVVYYVENPEAAILEEN